MEKINEGKETIKLVFPLNLLIAKTFIEN